MPSLTLLGQSLVSGLFIGGLYGLLGLGLGLSWGLLRLINLSHFALVLLGAYLTYQLAGTAGMNPFLTPLLIVPGFFLLGVVLQWAFDFFRVNEFSSLLVTFGITVVIESVIQWVWTADFRRLETPYATLSVRAGPLFLPDGFVTVNNIGQADFFLSNTHARRDRAVIAPVLVTIVREGATLCVVKDLRRSAGVSAAAGQPVANLPPATPAP